jgi:phosphoribosyl 1,2-cyclic phosphate phosphodiesterase
MSQAIILGSGTSNGVPMLGVQYPEPFLANPKNHRTRSSLLLQGPAGNVLIDCTPEMRLQLVREQILQLECVIVTHTHADHIMGMDDLRSLGVIEQRDIPIYTLAEHMADIRRVFAYAFREYPPGIVVPRFDLREMPDALEAGGLTIHRFLVDHGSTRVIGVRVNDFAYITDVSSIPEEAWPMLTGLDTLVMDAVRFKPHPNHFHYDRAVEVAEQIGARITYFTHLSHDYDHDVFEAQMPSHMRLAYDGLRVPL